MLNSGDGARVIRLILGDQLSEYHSWYKGFGTQADAENLYLMMEILPEAQYTLHHIQKLLAVFAAMRSFALELTERGARVLYLSINDPNNKHSFAANCQHIAEQCGAELLEYQEPDEYRLQQQLQKELGELPISVSCVSTEHFLSKPEDFKVKNAGTPDARAPVMESFYRHMRRMHNVLMEPPGVAGKGAGTAVPAGGSWNYDSENRKSWRGEPAAPAAPVWPNQTELLRSVANDIRAAGIKSFGSVELDTFLWPSNRENALKALERFLEHGLAQFGPFQDALSTKESFLFHSLISFPLNVKILHPREVIDAAVQRYQAEPDRIGLASVEGFVRQILGWREYMRRYYHWSMPEFAATNALEATRPLPSWYWTGECSMNCLHHAVTASLKNAYAHHIQRLMVTGNFAMLAGVNPDEVDRWYLGVYIDAFEWVEITNTRGMSQYADGGGIATKPYAAAAAYMNRMSDYCKGCSYDPKKRSGEGSCPLNSLYWDFVARHADRWQSNPRMAMPLRTWQRFAAAEQTAIREQARRYLDSIESL